MKRYTLITTLSLSLVVLGACGSAVGDRALSGGAIGAGAGFVGGAALGNPLAGALIGGAVGAGTGGMTTPAEVDLGPPVWE